MQRTSFSVIALVLLVVGYYAPELVNRIAPEEVPWKADRVDPLWEVKEYIDFHTYALYHPFDDWSSIDILAETGDEFSLHLCGIITETHAERLSDDQLRTIESARHKIKQRLEVNEENFDDRVLIKTWLERCAYVDFTCGPLETKFCPWILDRFRARSSDSAFRDTLTKLLADIELGGNADETRTGLETRMSDYLRNILWPYEFSSPSW